VVLDAEEFRCRCSSPSPPFLILLLILAVRRRVEARRLVRLFRAQEAWADRLDREGSRAA
jgi:hypothetical protein